MLLPPSMPDKSSPSVLRHALLALLSSANQLFRSISWLAGAFENIETAELTFHMQDSEQHHN